MWCIKFTFLKKRVPNLVQRENWTNLTLFFSNHQWMFVFLMKTKIWHISGESNVDLLWWDENKCFINISFVETATAKKTVNSTKFPHQEIRWNYGIFRSEPHRHVNWTYMERLQDVLDVFWTSYIEASSELFKHLR